MEIVNADVERYMRTLQARYEEPVLLEMEREAEELGFPIVDRLVGTTLEVLTRAAGARRVFEMGSGFGYSAYWFARGVGPEGNVILSDGDPENERKALAYLGRAGMADRIRFNVGDALEILDGTQGAFDVIFNDIDKGDYPRAWEAARDRVRVGGMYVCDNAIMAGRINVVTKDEGARPGWADAIDAHNRAVFSDDRYVATILPIREGDLVAVRVR